jgi:catechol 2,3-dioxygenase-like lactoylglutathione lyase family enzyme
MTAETREAPVAVKRIVPNVAIGPSGDRLEAAKDFYCGALGMAVAMDMSWIVTLQGAGPDKPQISFVREGGSGTPVPALSVEVDDLEEAYQAVLSANLSVEHGPVLEPWGVRRFFVRDPLGQLVNVMAHDRPDRGEPKE